MYKFYDVDNDCCYDFCNQKILKKYLFSKVVKTGKMTRACGFDVLKKVGSGYVPYAADYYPATGFVLRSKI